jgi:hypothetical protein
MKKEKTNLSQEEQNIIVNFKDILADRETLAREFSKAESQTIFVKHSEDRGDEIETNRSAKNEDKENKEDKNIAKENANTELQDMEIDLIGHSVRHYVFDMELVKSLKDYEIKF